jgi:protein-disulfide isomerase-like protein with CxxC motif
MAPARIYPWRKMRRSRVPSIAPDIFFVAQSWADCITNMAGFNLRQAQLETAVEQAIAVCDGDARAAIRALIVANNFLESEIAELMKAVSHAYTRGRFRTYTG